jgi:hypothetical protein
MPEISSIYRIDGNNALTLDPVISSDCPRSECRETAVWRVAVALLGNAWRRLA